MKFRILFYREWLTFWLTPTPYLAFIALLGATGYFLNRYITSYVQRVEQYQAGFLASTETPDLYHWVVEPYGETLAFFLLFVIPVCTARTFAEEKQSGQLQMLLSTAVRPFWIVAAKALACIGSMIALILVLLIPLLVLVYLIGGSLEPVSWVFLSLCFVIGFYVVVGLAISETVRQPIAAALLHLSLLLFLYFLHAAPIQIAYLNISIADLLSPVLHAKRMIQGVFVFSDIGYFIAMMSGALIYTTIHLSDFQRAPEMFRRRES